MKDLVIIGCGGFGREVADVVDAINRVESTWNLLGFVDDRPTDVNVARVERRGSALLGAVDGSSAPPDVHFVVGIGDGLTRRRTADLSEAAKWTPAVLVHPTAAVGANVKLGAGTIVCAHAAIGSDVVIGRHVHLDRAAQVGHDSTLDDFVTVHPAAVVSGECHVRDTAELGTNSTLMPSIVVGSRARIGAGACVVRNVADGATVKGVPAR